ncbi:MAG: IS6 family transposase [Candidatus Paracaedibacteraceae bacterium]|nr:IS6 family transposase [Candidatus Paracaedibacteraceae bacterium]
MAERYKGYRLPKAIIGYVVRLYFRYKLSLRDISELLLERGVQVTYEAIRLWVKVLGPLYAQAIRRQKGTSFRDKWHIDEMRVKVKGEVFWLWRLVDSQGEEIKILLQRRRDAKSAIRFLKKALKRTGSAPRVIITDQLRSYKKAHRLLLKRSQHRCHKRLNNRAENSHQPTREKEKQMRGFKSSSSTQRFLSSMGVFLNLLKVKRYVYPAQEYRDKLPESLICFNQIVMKHPQSI